MHRLYGEKRYNLLGLTRFLSQVCEEKSLDRGNAEGDGLAKERNEVSMI